MFNTYYEAVVFMCLVWVHKTLNDITVFNGSHYFLGMDELGIYRLSGIASEIQNLKKLFNERKSMDYFFVRNFDSSQKNYFY